MGRRLDNSADAWLKFWLRFTSEVEGRGGTRKGVVRFRSPAPWRVLAYLATLPPNQAASVAAIREGAALPSATATRALSALEDAGYIVRRSPAGDSRVLDSELTEAGRQALGVLFHSARSLP